MKRSVVVGASLAGLRAAEEIRRRDGEGSIVLIGAEASPPYTRPPLSKQILSGEWEPERSILRTEQDLAVRGIDLRVGRAATALDLDRRVVVLGPPDHDGAEVPFDRLVIATGATARRVPALEPAGGRLHLLRTVADTVALRAAFDRAGRVLVVGGGFIGAEVASSARARGLEVTIVEPQPVLLWRGLGPDLGRACTELHRSRGVDVRCGVSISRVTEGPDGARVELDDGSTIEADVIVAGVGAEPETRWLAGSGLAIGDGLLCDDACRALDEDGRPVPGVVAAGDVARWRHPRRGPLRLEHWTNAQEQASAAVSTLFADESGEPAVPFSPTPYVWSDQHGVKIQVVGEPPTQHRVHVVRGSADAGALLALVENDAGDLVGAVGIAMPGPLVKARQLVATGATLDDALRELSE